MKTKEKLTIIIYFIFICLCLMCLIDQFTNHNNIGTSIMCLATILVIPIIILLEKFFKLKINITLKIFFITFIYLSVVVGEVYSFYIRCSYLDIILHFSKGFFVSVIAFSIIDILNGKYFYEKLNIKFIILFNLCFVVFLGVLWEFYEYSWDKFLNKDYQKNVIINNVPISTLDENKNTVVKNIRINELVVNGEDWISLYGGYIDIGINDTMKDLFVCIIASIIANIFIYFYIKNKRNFIKYLIIEKI